MSSHGHSSSSADGINWHVPTVTDLEGTLPGYKVLSLIGRGGMGAVYKARQISLDRLVAIKVLPPDGGDGEQDYAERFRIEAQLMARIMHPGMIAVFDFGQMPGGQHYFVMEYMEGTDVAQMLARQGRLEPMHAISITAHVCDALGYAHERGIVHRDIKPANVMVDVEGRVKVADFGLAKHTIHDAAEALSTKTMGTPDYVAPESLITGVTVDGRADLYSLGVMFYEMLTGTVPRGQFAPASQCVPGLDRRLDDVITRAMQRDPGARFSSAGEFRQALNHVLSVPAAKASPPKNAPYRPAGQPSVRQASSAPAKGGVPWGMIGLVVLILGGGAFFLLKKQSETKDSITSTAESSTPATTTAPATPTTQREATPAAPAPTTVASTAPSPELPPSSVTPASPPMPVAQPSPTTPKAGGDPEASRRLQELEVQFRNAFEREVTQVHANAMKDLDARYAGALERALSGATSSSDLQAAVALRDEKQRLASNQPMPSTDATNAPKALKDLRQIYRTTSAEIETKRNTDSGVLYDKYLGVLTAYQDELTKAGRLDGALEVSNRIKDLQSSNVNRVASAPSAAPTNLGPAGALEKFLTGTKWQWRGVQGDERVELEPTGRVIAKSWANGGLTIGWEVTGPNEAVLKILEGRTQNTEAHLVFAEDRSHFTGTDFTGKPFVAKCPRIPDIQVTPALLEKAEPWAGYVTFPAGEYRLKHRAVVGAPDPEEPKRKLSAIVTSLPGARLEGGAAFVDKGIWRADGTLFSRFKLTAEVGSQVEASNSLFSQCELGKGGGWFVDYFSSKWTFENCVFTGSFFEAWKILDVGAKVEHCTFHEVDFAPVQYKKDAGEEVTREWASIKNCRFIGCKIPESFLLMTKDCIFESCTFGPPETQMPLTTPVKIRAYLSSGTQPPVMGPGREIEILDAKQAPAGTGSSLRYGKTGMTLSFR
jgi:serine/threonine protein kinase